jgi:pyridoxine/pyridoxamine 5'-phosphate oxidase
MTAAALRAFLRGERWGVVATTAVSGAPQAAVVGVAVTDALELVFDTLGDSHKARNLRRDGRVAVVMGWDQEQTVQIEGIADEPSGAELERIKNVYFDKFPDGPSRLSWPGLTYVRVRPTWIRYSDFRGADPVIVERTAEAWLAA